MIIQAELRRKQSEYEGEACSVDKVIELPAQRFKQFSRALLADYPAAGYGAAHLREAWGERVLSQRLVYAGCTGKPPHCG